MTKDFRFPSASGRVIAAALLSYTCTTAPATAQTTIALTQYSYDAAERMQCTTVRMNPAAFGSPPADVCTPSTQQAIDPDRVTRYSRDATGRPLQIQLAYGTSAQATDKTFTYTPDGMVASMADANNNLTTMTYDGYDRLSVMYFPAPSNAGNSSQSDYEAYGYDANGNRRSLRKRDGRTLGYTYDALNRITVKTVPTSCVSGYTCTNPPGWATRSVYYAYDLLGHQTEARFDSSQGGEGVFSGYDGLGQLTSSITVMSGASRQLMFGYDIDGNRTQVTFPDKQQFNYSYDKLDRETLISQQGGGGLVSTSYDAIGQLNAYNRMNSAQSSFSYDAAGRMTGISHDLSGSAYDQSYGLGYNPASQVNSLSESNDGYAWRGAANANIGYQVNGLNQYTNVGGAGYGYDSNGNLTSDGSTAYVYDAENRLVSASSGTTLTYDANGRLWQVAGGPSGMSQFLYDGDQLAAEYAGSGNLQRRYLHGAGEDNPLIWYEGSGLGSPRFYHADHQGSIVAVSDANGNPVTINSYDEYGMPAQSNSGRFGYTGQAWLPDLGLSYYKARVYSPRLGRFLQTDPVGYKDQSNLYAYVANDPVNATDPSGQDGQWIYNKTTGQTSLRIPVYYHGAGATPEAVASIKSRVEGLSIPNSRYKIEVIVLSSPGGKGTNSLDLSPGEDRQAYPTAGEGINKLGGNVGHINSSNGDYTSASAHDTLHFVGIKDRYVEGSPNADGSRGASMPSPGYTDRNIMTSRQGSELNNSQFEESRRNPSTQRCTVKGTATSC